MNRAILLILTFGLLTATAAFGQDFPYEQQQDNRIGQVERKLSDLENKVKSRSSDAANTGGVAMLFGAFCALWAQNTNRSAWLWFFLGLLFSVIAVIFLLVKNSDDRFARQQKERFKHEHT